MSNNLKPRSDPDAEPPLDLPDPIIDGVLVRFIESEVHQYLRRLAERSGRAAPEFAEPQPGMAVRMISKQAFAAMIGIHPVSLMRRLNKQRARRAAAKAGSAPTPSAAGQHEVGAR